MERRMLQGQYAGFLSRAIAMIIDLLFVLIAILAISWFISAILQTFLGLNVAACPITGGTFSDLNIYICQGARIFLILFGIWFGPIYFIVLWVLTGQTIGKYIMGVRIVRINGRHVNFFTAIIRYFGYFISLIPFGLGFLRVLTSDQRRGWHDRLAGTCVIYSWEAHQNEEFLERVKQYRQRRRQKV